jgi:tetratricopeptide (TPR) repeat protein
MTPSSTQRQSLHAWLTAVPPALAADAPLLADLLGAPLEAAALPPLPPEEQKWRLQRACVQVLLQPATVQPLCLLIEDLHWLDPSSQELLDLLVTAVAGQPVLVLGTARPGFRDTWSDHTYYHRLTVVPLSEALTATFIDNYLQPYGAAPALTALLCARTAGNPFFLEEMLRTLQEQELLVIQDDVYGVPPNAPLTLSTSVQGLLAARIDRLPAEAKVLLQTAAVIGKDVPLALLRAIADVPEATLHRGLAHLQAAEFLYETRLFPEPEYTFKHALTHEVAYGSLLQERRRLLHARIVAALEQHYADRLAEQVEPLALHAFRGAVWDKAVTYARQAGARARDRAVFHQAATYFEQALAALGHLPDTPDTRGLAIDLRLDLRSAIYPLGELEQVLVYLREAAVLAEVLGDQRRLGQVSVSLAIHFSQAGEPDHTLTFGQRALAIAADLEDVGLTVTAQQQLGQAYRSLGDFRRAVECFHKNMACLHGELLRECFGLPGLASVVSRSFLILSLAECGAFAEGRAVAEEGVRLAEAADHSFSCVQAYMAVGFRALRQGDLLQAIPVLERALDLVQGAHIRLLVPRVAAPLGAAYALTGRTTDALPLLEQAVEQALAMRYMFDHGLQVAWLGEAYLLAGRLDEAYTQAQHALAFSRAQQERGHEAYALRLLGECHARHAPPEVEPAETYYRQALTLAEALGMRPLQAHCHHGLGRLYSHTGQRKQARVALTTAIDMYRAMDMTFWLPQAEAALAQMT